MKVLFVNPYYKPYLGGIERVIENLGRELIKKNHQVGILTTHFSFPRRLMKGLPDYEKKSAYEKESTKISNHYDTAQYHSEGGIEIFRIKSFPQKNIFPFFQVPLVWFSRKGIFKIIEKFNPDIIHFMTDKWFWVNLMIARRVRARRRPRHQPDQSVRPRLIFSPIFHDLTLSKQILRHFNYFLGNLVDIVLVETNLEKEKVKKAYWVAKEKMKVLFWGVDILEFEKSPTLPYSGHESTSKSDQRLTILAVGRLSKHKGQMKLLQLYHDCLNKFHKPTQLVLVGHDEGELARITNYELRITEKGGKLLIITDASDEQLEGWYQRSDLFVLFPEYEAFGLAFLEAMAHGIPVLTHQVGALPEILKKGAVLTKPLLFDSIESHPNYQEVRQQLIKLVNDDHYRHHLVNEAYQYVRENFSWEKTTERLLKIYQAI